jgi:creatinine amidohydrolase/Fe(II)-dependent formamide hydrolase-like protein
MAECEVTEEDRALGMGHASQSMQGRYSHDRLARATRAMSPEVWPLYTAHMLQGCRLLTVLLLASWMFPATVSAQMLRAETLTTGAFAAIDRERTVVIIPGGILEEHGPYLPAGSDIYQAEWLSDALARRLARRDGQVVLMLPMMSLGHSGANDIARRWIHPGTITVRSTTLRAIYMDLADALGAHGFRHIFVVDVHGAPDHNQAIDQASDYFNDTWRGTMVHLMGLKSVNTLPPLPAAIVPEAAAAADGFTVHAGLLESSRVLFVRPDQVHKGLFNAPPLTARDFPALVTLGKAAGWPGYWGAPAASTATIGAAALEQTLDAITTVAVSILERTPWSRERFYTEANMDAADVQISRESAVRESELRAKQQAWLRRSGLDR